MITSLVEPGGARPGDATRRTVIVTMFAYTALAAIVAGAASIGAGLGVIALGMLFTILIDLRQWRDIVDHDRAHAPPQPARVALPKSSPPQRAIAPPTPAVTQGYTTTRLLPYSRPSEPALLEATPVPVAPEPVSVPEPAPASEDKVEAKAETKAEDPAKPAAAKPAAKPAAKSKSKPKKA